MSGLVERLLDHNLKGQEGIRAEAADKIEGLEADLDSAIEVAWNRGAKDWVRMNYPSHYDRFMGFQGQPSPRLLECEACAGTGFKVVSLDRASLVVTFDMKDNCPECDGEGRI